MRDGNRALKSIQGQFIRAAVDKKPTIDRMRALALLDAAGSPVRS
jgi:hypothetical protein